MQMTSTDITTDKSVVIIAQLLCNMIPDIRGLAAFIGCSCELADTMTTS